ncbi:hypothetical protein [Runella sp.]|uniref:hypothetical protein n=1 Tax=Runella sp. TaxID=1960881 RepID=UPI003D0B1991
MKFIPDFVLTSKKYFNLISQKLKQGLKTTWKYLKNRKWNWEALIALAAFLYSISDNNSKDADNKKETKRISERDSTQIALLTQTFLDSRVKDSLNRLELKRIRTHDSIQLAIQIERNNFDRQEFYRVRQRDSAQLAAINNQIKATKLTGGPELRASFPSVFPFYLTRPRPAKDTLDFGYRFIIINAGKTDLKNLRVRSFMTFGISQKPIIFKAFSLVSKHSSGEINDLLPSNETAEFVLGLEKNTKIVVDRLRDILTIHQTKQTYLVPKKDVFILLEFIYDDIYGDERKYYRIISYNQNFRYSSDEKGAVQIFEFISPKRKLTDEIKGLKDIIQEHGFDYKIFEQIIRRENTIYDSFFKV